MINKVFIPNRGEIAVRIINAAKKLGIKTVVALWREESASLAATLANEVHWWDTSTLADTYLSPENIAKAALRCGADAVHPGYGFLSENHLLARCCSDNHLTFIGPKVEHMEQMGDKTWARRLAELANIPVLKGWDGDDLEKTTDIDTLPYPLLIKAAMGGGGKAMHIVNSANELHHKLVQAKGEAKRYFGDGRVFVERYIANPRHIEVQILADAHGHTLHLGERECSIQRRHQKIVEEAPATNLPDHVRQTICADAVRLAQSINYQNAGTIEFLLDESNQHYFLEMNTRIQVEHAVTEQITGIDLVAEQFSIANGDALRIVQEEIVFRGHAIETRIYAENPMEAFAPSPGELTQVEWPTLPNSRIDTAVIAPQTILPDFDPMLAKLITWGPTRNDAIGRHRQTLSQCLLSGIANNIGYLQSILSHPAFADGLTDTHFCETHERELLKPYHEPASPLVLLAFAIWKMAQINTDQFGGNATFYRHLNHLKVLLNGKEHHLQLPINQTNEFTIDAEHFSPSQISCVDGHISFVLEGDALHFWVQSHCNEVALSHQGIAHQLTDGTILPHYQPNASPQSATNGDTLTSPIPGRIVKVNVEAGEKVKKGHTLVVLEAMKMENHLKAWKDGTVQTLEIGQGTTIKANQTILTLN